jgi:cytochrome c oxidase assembly factor CtaG
MLALAAGYLTAAVAVNRRDGRWPVWRTAWWCAGLDCAWVAVAGPIATAAHHDFTANMAGHLLLGMAAPLLLVHAHMLVAGYLFTAAIIGRDPAPHRPGHPVRAAVLVAFLAAHGILAKHVYAHPPHGVLPAQAQTGAQLMYYGGDALDLILIGIFCWQWYAATDPNPPAPVRRRAWRLPADIAVTDALHDTDKHDDAMEIAGRVGPGSGSHSPASTGYADRVRS